MRKLTASDYQVMPWKNGGGVTTQLAVFPHGAGLDSFDWRISTAQVNSNGPFSLFPEIDRSLAVIKGQGMILTDANGECCRMNAGSEPFVFRGEQGIDAQLHGGTIIDFNVMTRRSSCTHLLELAELQGTLHCTPHGDLMLVYVAEGGSIACRGMHADAGESILVDWREESEFELTASSPTVLCLAHITFKEKRND